MDIIICEPNVPPYIKSICGKFTDLQEIIGENVKAVSLNHPSIIIFCNQDHFDINEKANNNCRLAIPGTFIFAGRDKNRLRSLSNDEMDEIFHTIRKEDFTLV